MNEMAHDAHSLLGAYVVDAVDHEERASFEAHLAVCADCRADVAALREVVADLADADAVAPPSRLRRAVLDGAAQTSQVPPTLPVSRTRGGTTRRRLTWMLGAAAAVVIAVAGISLASLPSDDHVSALERDVMTVASAPDAHSVELPLGQSHVVMSDRMGEVAIMGHDAPMPAKGMEYQLWLVLNDGHAMPGPTFMPNPEGDLMALAPLDGYDVASFTVTEEPRGGSQAPSGRLVASIDL